jgi:hypothetical protein
VRCCKSGLKAATDDFVAALSRDVNCAVYPSDMVYEIHLSTTSVSRRYFVGIASVFFHRAVKASLGQHQRNGTITPIA